MRVPHFLPPSKSQEFPSACIWFDTETKVHLDKKGREIHRLWFGWACYQRTTRHGKWTTPEWYRFTTRDHFWLWVLGKTRARTRLVMFAHNGAFDLPVVGAFTELPSRGMALQGAVCDAPPIILTWKGGDRTIRFIDTLNLWRVPLSELGKSVGIPKLPMPSPSSSSTEWDAYGQNDADIIRVACLRWFDFLRDNQLGGFAATLASQAMVSFRHRFMSHPIFVDNNEKGLDMARAAYLGGRVECFRLGKYSGQFVYVDRNSMYPAEMKDNLFPTKLVGVYTRVTWEELAKWRKKYFAIVECTVQVKEPCLPMVRDNRLVFPIGKFSGSWCGPEILPVLDSGGVVSVQRVALYEQAPIFTAFVDYFYRQRLAAMAKGDTTAAFLYKILMNSLYGKFGQRGRRYEDGSECDADLIAVWDNVDAHTGVVTHFRQFGGLVQEWIDEGESRHSHPAIAAAVTSYARRTLWETIKQVGRKDVYYCDTDSLIVTASGFERLMHQVDATALGAWKVEKAVHLLDLYGAKDYVCDGVAKRKGIRATAQRISDDAWQQAHFVGFRGLLREGSLDAPIVYPIEKHLTRRYTKGVAMPSGSVRPLRLGRR